MIEYSCSRCSALLQTADEMALHMERCPVCGNQRMVPRPAGVATTQRVAAPVANPAPPKVIGQPAPPRHGTYKTAAGIRRPHDLSDESGRFLRRIYKALRSLIMKR